MPEKSRGRSGSKSIVPSKRPGVRADGPLDFPAFGRVAGWVPSRSIAVGRSPGAFPTHDWHCISADAAGKAAFHPPRTEMPPDAPPSAEAKAKAAKLARLLAKALSGSGLRPRLPQRLRAAGRHRPVRPMHRRPREPGDARPVRPLPRRPEPRPRRTGRGGGPDPPDRLLPRKSRHLIGLARAIVERHGGAVPDDLDALTALPGVGRKTANVVLGNAFGIASGVVVDTHVKRLATRLGLTARTDPVRIERELAGLFPKSRWVMLQPPADRPRPIDVQKPCAPVAAIVPLESILPEASG